LGKRSIVDDQEGNALKGSRGKQGRRNTGRAENVISFDDTATISKNPLYHPGKVEGKG